MASELFVAAPFANYARGQVITDPAVIAGILAGPYSDHVVVAILTTGGSSGSNSIVGVPTAIQVGAAIAGTYQASALGQFVCLRIAGSDVLPRTALPATSGSLPTLSASSVGTGTLAMYAAATGGSPLFETGSIIFTTSAPVGVVLAPNAPLIGSDAFGAPTVVTVGTGLALQNGALISTASPGAIILRGAWTASTVYAAGDIVTYQGSSYAALAAFTSGSSFVGANWQLVAQKGDPGVGGSATIATPSAPGIVKPGSGLAIAGDGTLTATATAPAIATTSAVGTVKPDGTTLTVDSTGTASIISQTIGSTPAITDLTADFSIPADNGASTGAHLTRAQLIALTLANDDSSDLAATTALSSIPGDFAPLGLSAGAFAKVTWAMLRADAVAAAMAAMGGSTATAPGQVGSLAAGTPTSATVPLTWTAPSTGTAPITYAVQQSPHGANTWTNSAGTFGATGGTVTGLTASTSYDFRVIATNSAGSSTTTLSNVSDGVAVSYPAFAFTEAASFGTGKFSQALTAGKGTASITLISNGTGASDLVVSEWVVFGTTSSNPARDFTHVVIGSQTFGWYLSDTIDVLQGNGNSTHTYVNPFDGLAHYLRFVISSTSSASTVSYFIDGVSKYSGSCGLVSPGTATLLVDRNALNTGGYIDDLEILNSAAGLTNTTVPTTAATRTGSTMVIYPFDGSASGV